MARHRGNAKTEDTAIREWSVYLPLRHGKHARSLKHTQHPMQGTCCSRPELASVQPSGGNGQSALAAATVSSGHLGVIKGGFHLRSLVHRKAGSHLPMSHASQLLPQQHRIRPSAHSNQRPSCSQALPGICTPCLCFPQSNEHLALSSPVIGIRWRASHSAALQLASSALSNSPVVCPIPTLGLQWDVPAILVA